MTALRVTPEPSARAIRAALMPLAQNSSSRSIRSLWGAPIGLFGAQRQKNGQQEQGPAGVSG
jgi:hypothetical protein